MSVAGQIVYIGCVGGQLLKLLITPTTTTCGELIAQIKTKLELETCANGFGLFEFRRSSGSTWLEEDHLCHNLDDTRLVSAVVSNKTLQDIDVRPVEPTPDDETWQLTFKIFLFYEPRHGARGSRWSNRPSSSSRPPTA